MNTSTTRGSTSSSKHDSEPACLARGGWHGECISLGGAHSSLSSQPPETGGSFFSAAAVAYDSDVTASPVYFVYVGERQIGPLTRADLEARAARSEIGTEDLVWETGTLGWVKAAEVVDFDLIRYAGRASPAEGPPRREARSADPPVSRSFLARVRDFVSDLGSLPGKEIVPLSRLLDPESLGVPASWVLLVFGLGPLFLGTVLEEPGIRVRLFNAGCGALWLTFFVAVWRRGRVPIRPGLLGLFLAVLASVLLVTFLPGLPPVSWLAARLGPSASFSLNLAGYLLVLAPLQELGKAALTLFLARALSRERDLEVSTFQGVMTGLGFGLYEAAVFTDWAAPGLLVFPLGDKTSIALAFQAAFVSGIVRMISLPLLHGVWTGMTGYFVGFSYLSGKRPAAILLAGLSIPIALHGSYRAFLASGFGFFAFLCALMSLLLFLAYSRNARKSVDEAPRPVPPR
ncbi:MAG: hypothetical protein DIJKHBIC_03998 [Thermoanaerobaculia bacterium]|nr:hypothetical protein [Thermoanaerobaculia bacterium]